MTNIFTIKQLSEFIKTKIPNTFLNIKGEIRQPKISGGHMYMMMKDDTATISCVIWKSKMTDIISKLKDGDMIEAKGNLDFYVPRGELKFIISTITKEKTVGDMFAEFEKMKSDFTKQGYFNKKLPLPGVIRKIAVLTSKTGAAIHDFTHALSNNKSLVECDIIDMVVQGADCPRNIVEYLRSNDMKKYDMVVITRGGGSMEDLWGFNDKKLIETIYNRDYVVLSAIGHMVDTTLLDFASDITCATPSLAAQYIVDNNKDYLDKLNNIKNRFHMSLIGDINKKLSLLDRYDNIKNDFNEKLINKMKNYKQTIMYEIKNRLVQLDRIEDRYKENIALYSDNKNLTSDDFGEIVKLNKHFTIVWNGIVVNVNNYNVIY
jgi:exodeoxyribonuclease VII large subunit